MRRTPLRPRPRVDHSSEPGYRAWHAPVYAACQACGEWGLLLRHHVVTEQHVRAAKGDPWDLRNSLLLGVWCCRCHRDHHGALRRLPVSLVDARALAFAVELLGEDGAADYLARYYRVG